MQNKRKMTLLQRAKQFMPFSALKGFQELLDEVATHKVGEKELSPDQLEVLDRQLRNIPIGTEISVVYYKQYAYVTQGGILQKIDPISNTLVVGGEPIPVGKIIRISNLHK